MKCKECGKEFDRKEVERIQGELFPYGFCSARCYTKKVYGLKGEE